jgi:ribonuclease HI
MTLISVYTDGCSINNGKIGAKAGMGVYFGSDDKRNVSKRLEGDIQTNNRAELTAILIALEIIISTEKYTETEFVIFSDSAYSINAVTDWIHNWKKNNWMTAKKTPVKNKDIIENIYNLMMKIHKLKFKHIRAHTGKLDVDSIGNMNADRLANESVL